jgi:hypothetical protein
MIETPSEVPHQVAIASSWWRGLARSSLDRQESTRLRVTMIAEMVDIETGDGYSALTTVRGGTTVLTQRATPSFQVRS